MGKVKVDLHIHSVLSPCGDLLMTPLNIIKKAVKEDIKIIAITDHNSAQNIEIAVRLAKNHPLIIVPSMEVETNEEVHILCLFKQIKPLMKLEDFVYNNLPNKKNNEDIFGPQLITDINDDIIAREEKLLATATDIEIGELVEKVYNLGGIVIPSHVDKNFGLIRNLGLIPPELSFFTLEIFKKTKINDFLNQFPLLKDYNLIKNSDSHYLDEIKAQMEVSLKKVNISSLFQALKRKTSEIDFL